jgi:hypothetical protein
MSFQRKAKPKMELFRTDQYYIFVNGEYGLWWDRTTGEFNAKSGNGGVNHSHPLCLVMSHK